MYRIEVKVRLYSPQRGDYTEWKPVRPSNSTTPYQWDTEKEAEFMKRMCYGGMGDARVVKVES